ncbi:uncharacterized protein BO97DRAFT_424316 [Aspergillus homomorphus CBS 101889]|uniref:Nephrocystin 3-like N-terminal domain-containing protein n=1 Tax=Aspergillus homomorphus (strain CBS 101889) TaxID=1450537 RepID=A0A395HY23_ASPHC|nr:hypothetical protein BO97DRAFT_424316 [Aspergillus homomorphus CBS 101889]RAL12680.1 hypothetical protein BO97DRAFT_424316 [Aspergillus homomorphus CBS 101889]
MQLRSPEPRHESLIWGEIHIFGGNGERVGEHNVVITSLLSGVYGTTSVATTAIRMLASFPRVRIGLLVGVGGGIARPEKGYDIRLGDIAVKVLLKAMARLQAHHERRSAEVPDILAEMLQKNAKMAKAKHGYVHQGFENDRLFQAQDPTMEVFREPRDSADPEFHYGTIASGYTLLKDAFYRDKILEDGRQGCICFEMEAAGLMNAFPCVVIRGISDYADSHKNDQWQRKSFIRWSSGSYRHLWLHGISSCGKTVLSATILQHLSQHVKSSSHATLFLFFDFAAADKQSLEQLVRSLVAQLFFNFESSQRELRELFASCSNAHRQLSLESLLGTFLLMVSHLERVQIVIDALDECDTKKDLVDWLKSISSPEHANVFLIATSRLGGLHASLMFLEECLDLEKLEECLVSSPDSLGETTLEFWSASLPDDAEVHSNPTVSGFFRATRDRPRSIRCSGGRSIQDSLFSPRKEATGPSRDQQAASSRGHAEFIHRILAQGFDVNQTGGHFGCALQAAGFGGRMPIVEALLANGANVNASGGYHGSALQTAVRSGNTQVVETLLARGVSIDAPDGRHGNPL